MTRVGRKGTWGKQQHQQVRVLEHNQLGWLCFQLAAGTRDAAHARTTVEAALARSGEVIAPAMEATELSVSGVR